MGRVTLILGLVLSATMALHAQRQQQPAAQQSSSSQQPAKASPTDEGGKNGNTQSAADTPGAAEAAVATNDRNTATDSTADGERASNTPAVAQTTSSSSGSPAVISDDNGSGRDGTNNVQRASMNMAGSPVNNIRLGRARTADADQEMRDRQDYERDKRNSAQEAGGRSGGRAVSGKSNEINERSRRENNALSDQNLSSKDKGASQNAQNKKSAGKTKKKKDRG